MLQLQACMFHAQRSRVSGVRINEDSFEIKDNYTNDYDAIRDLAEERTRTHKLKERIWRYRKVIKATDQGTHNTNNK